MAPTYARCWEGLRAGGPKRGRHVPTAVKAVWRQRVGALHTRTWDGASECDDGLDKLPSDRRPGAAAAK